MSYVPYATVVEYRGLYPDASIEDSALTGALRTASRHIDTLTWNRIVSDGFNSLTEFQQEVIREVCCRQANFEIENADLIQSVLSQYSINGVQMQFGTGWTVEVVGGVAIRKELYGLLKQTGLCCTSLNGWRS